MKFCCIPSPASKISSSPPRIITAEDRPLVAVGIAAEVPKNTILIPTIIARFRCLEGDFIVIRSSNHISSNDFAKLASLRYSARMQDARAGAISTLAKRPGIEFVEIMFSTPDSDIFMKLSLVINE